jgi:hypothetical protein
MNIFEAIGYAASLLLAMGYQPWAGEDALVLELA